MRFPTPNYQSPVQPVHVECAFALVVNGGRVDPDPLQPGEVAIDNVHPYTADRRM